ncbi:stem cell self-renewal protein Piwi, partial [Lophiostoma macrostomum CBS 122681]
KIDTIILGADVTHTQKDSKVGVKSLAAVVGSVDENFGLFGGSMRSQERDQEIVDGMADMFRERLRAFHKKQNRVPTKILYYRDGVDNGQYYAVRKDEISKIRVGYQKFCREIDLSEHPDPQITCVVVTKRHRTRFYPKTPPSSNPNCIQGTCVDSGVTHPNYFDFFLQSHNPGPGTTKPTYYIAIENGMGFTATELQDFTNMLCYTYVRTTSPVGYAPPAYYADRLCDRARCYFANFLRDLDEDKSKKKSMTEAQIKEETTRLWERRFAEENQGNTHGPWHEKLNDTMFWM